MRGWERTYLPSGLPPSSSPVPAKPSLLLELRILGNQLALHVVSVPQSRHTALSPVKFTQGWQQRNSSLPATLQPTPCRASYRGAAERVLDVRFPSHQRRLWGDVSSAGQPSPPSLSSPQGWVWGQWREQTNSSFPNPKLETPAAPWCFWGSGGGAVSSWTAVGCTPGLDPRKIVPLENPKPVRDGPATGPCAPWSSPPL